MCPEIKKVKENLGVLIISINYHMKPKVHSFWCFLLQPIVSNREHIWCEQDY